jgi:outer membrane protein TolC
LVAAALPLAACVSYAPESLPRPTPLDPAPSEVQVVRGLTRATLDRLVLRQNPDLIAARARLGVADAQLIEANVLPNPQLTASYPFYVAGPGGTDAFALGLAQDLRALILRPVRREAALNAGREVRAALLWQEWQTIGKARLLFVDLQAGERRAALIARTRQLFQDRLGLTRKSVDQGNGPLTALSPDLVAVADIERAADEIDRLQLGRRHQLNALMGRSADAPLTLSATREPVALDLRRVARDLASLADRRPDLVALQYGYRSQDARLRQAILAQFPNVTIGLAGGRDTSAIYSVAPQASLELPLFDRNEGNIAIEAATREALNVEFGARVKTAMTQIQALASEQALLRRQLAALQRRLGETKLIAEKSETAFRLGQLDERSYVDIEASRLTEEQEKVGLEQALADGEVELATLTGAGLPTVLLAPEEPPADPLGLLHAFAR